MESNLKNQILGVGLFILTVIILVSSDVIFSVLNPFLSVFILYVFYNVIVIAPLVKYLYEVEDRDIGFQRFIPIWNESLLFSKTEGFIYIFLHLLVVVFGILSLLEYSWLFDKVPLSFILDINTRLIYTTIFLIVLTFIYGAVVFVINYNHLKTCLSVNQDKIANSYYLLLLVPIVRAAALLPIVDALRTKCTIRDLEREYDLEEIE